MEKIDLEKEFKNYEGDFIALPASYKVLGFKNMAWKDKKGQQILSSVLLVQREDGLEITLFSDQLRKEGSALFVSASHLKAQMERQEVWSANRAKPKQ